MNVCTPLGSAIATSTVSATYNLGPNILTCRTCVSRPFCALARMAICTMNALRYCDLQDARENNEQTHQATRDEWSHSMREIDTYCASNLRARAARSMISQP